MNSRKSILTCITLTLLVLAAGMVKAVPLGTAIKYNGHLREAGNPANGTYDVIFNLWDAEADGNLVASSSASGVTVEDGVLSVSPDFGDVFNGQAYWLEIQIKKSNQPNYQTLAPRQPLGATAYALHAPKAGRAQSAANADKADGVNANAVQTDGLQNFAVTKGKLANGAVGKDQLETDAVEQDKIKNGAVSKDKLAKPAVGKDELEDAAVEEAKIKDEAVTAAKIKAGEVVKSVNGLKDAVTLSAGTSITLTPSGNDIQIAANGGPGSGLDADLLDGQHASAFATAAHTHSGADITSGIVSETRIDAAIARDSEVFSIVTANDGPGSGLDADLLDGQHSSAFALTTHNHDAAYWKRTGNAGTVPGTDFLGTTDNQPLQLHVNGMRALRIEPNPGGLANFIGGAQNNIVTPGAVGSTIAGGSVNTVEGNHSVIGGGANNAVHSSFSVIGGGQYNSVVNDFGMVPGGDQNSAAERSFAAGHRAKANQNGSFVWSDSCDFDFVSNDADEFAVRATGGVRFVSALDNLGTPIAGVRLAPGSGSWTDLSDRNAKENFSAVNSREVLAKVAALPMSVWNYKSQDASIRHLGPMAQDFKVAFGLGESDTGITAIDADGVALAAIQGLNQKVDESEASLRAENAQLKQEVAELRQMINQLRAQLEGGAK